MNCPTMNPCHLDCPYWEQCDNNDKKDTVRIPIGCWLVAAGILTALVLGLIFFPA